MSMLQEEFNQFIRTVICEHPEWIEGGIRAMNYGALDRVEKEVDRRANADVALAFVLSTKDGMKAFKSLPDDQKKKVADSADTGSFGGTPWSKSLQ